MLLLALTLALAAVIAVSGNLQFVGHRSESVLPGNIVKGIFQGLSVEFYYLTAFDTDQMLMVQVIVHMFIVGTLVNKNHPPYQSAFFQQGKRPVHRCPGYPAATLFTQLEI
jgi:hypothetical protein